MPHAGEGERLHLPSIPEALNRATSIKAGKFVLVAHGTAAEVAKARDLLKISGAEQIDSYEATTGATRAA